ncbi:MAG: hypothetical protein K6G65_00060 [Lachnospiraceae bacterium]|nr:hypothetical protein [Lachnospiraceae bacterium]
MKKRLMIIMAVIMAFSMVACGPFGAKDSGGNAGTEEAQLSGGWGEEKSPVVTEELKALFEKASQAEEADYIPVAYLRSQVVAGMNHEVLCQKIPKNSEGTGTYAIVILYEDVQGNASITDVFDSSAETFASGLDGGWVVSEEDVLPKEAEDALDKAAKEGNKEYEGAILIGTQVVAGMNYMYLCKGSTEDGNAALGYKIVQVYEDLDGKATVTEEFGFTN